MKRMYNYVCCVKSKSFTEKISVETCRKLGDFVLESNLDVTYFVRLGQHSYIPIGVSNAHTLLWKSSYVYLAK